MSDQKRRRWSAQEKLAIIEEARKGGLSVGAVCRKHQLAPQLFYEWERKSREGSLEKLNASKRSMRSNGPTRTLAEAEEENTRLKEVIAEIAQENLRLKKGRWP
jgi:transposase